MIRPLRCVVVRMIAVVVALAAVPLWGQPATMPTTSRQIQDVPVLSWDRSGQTTFCGALSAALSVTDRPRDYATLMGDTGLAFRIRWWVADDGKGWDMSSPIGEFTAWHKAAERAIGWDIHWEVHFDDGKTDMAKFKPDVVRSIDAGLPALVYGKTLDVGVVYGYESGGDVLLVRDYFEGDKPTSVPIKDVKRMLAFLADKHEAPARRDCVLAGLRMASDDWGRAAAAEGTSPFGKGSYLFGDQAYASWIESLRNADALPEDRRKSLFSASWWTMCTLVDARQTAVRYLKASAGELDGPANEAVLAAAAIYEGAAGPAAAAIFMEKSAFLGPWSGRSIADWTAAVREREIDILTKFREADREAIRHLREAVE